MKKTRLKQYASLIANVGARVQKGQEVMIFAELDQPEFVKMVVEECYKAFTDKNEAEEYASALNNAMKLLGITSLPDAEVYKQKVNSI